ncbi:MAG: hypothetical protein J7539_01980 [Niabella sp.]|nr:hypothetical protein [Niabella sp.]
MAILKKISVTVNFEQPPKEAISLIGFLFNCNGLLLRQQPVYENLLEFDLYNTPSFAAAEMEHQFTPIDSRELRLFIAPGTDQNITKVTSIEALEPFKPYEAILNVENDASVSILPIPSFVSRFWPLCSCRVTGKVSKWLNRGGSWSDRPVCRARVHICEIDPILFWIDKIPDTVIAKIPQVILNPQEVIKFPIPVPDPPPFMAATTGIRQSAAANIFRTLSADDLQMQAAARLPELSYEIRQNMASGNLNLIRRTIVDHYAELHPWFCLWPWWWWWFYRCTERKVVYTDANGRFDTAVSYYCFGDRPDLYFWVEYLINGVWTTVYAPPKPCNTYWDYACGTNVAIHITDPRVSVDCCCNCPLPGDLVMIRSIGSTSVSHIRQQVSHPGEQPLLEPPPGQSISYSRIGLTDSAAIYDEFFTTSIGDYKRPFGGSLGFYMGFGQGLPNNNIYYYRWSYKKLNNADLSPVTGTTLQLDTPEFKGYDFEYIDGMGDLQIGHDQVKLGPFPVGMQNNLYIIPPSSPNQAPFNITKTDPQWYERTHNMHTIGFDSSQLQGDGLYEFTLELFDQAGTLLSNIPKTTFKVPKFEDADTSVNAPDELLAGVTPTTANAFSMSVRVDNSSCNSQIFTVDVNGVPAASDCCGFVNYKPEGVEADLDLSFLATHPNNFAVFSFGVTRGTCVDDTLTSLADATGMVIDSASGYTLSGGTYKKHFTPAQLLGSCYGNGEGKAAFAETLSVIAMATDGTYRQTSKDAPYRVAAFALEP